MVAGLRAEVAVRALDPTLSVVSGDLGVQAVQKDGKLLLVSPVSLPDGAWHVSLQRYTSDGATDPAFDASSLQAREIDELVALPGGKTLVVGRFGANPNASANRDEADDDDDDDSDVPLVLDPDLLVRLNADGSQDAAFQLPVLPLDWITAVDVLNDGGLLLSGFHNSSTLTDEITPFGLARITPDGKVDASFHGDFAAGLFVQAVHVQSDGRIVIIAEVGDAAVGSTLYRLNADGSPDPTFHSGLPPGVGIDAAILLDDDRLIVATDPNENSRDVATLYRLNGDGSTDPGYAVKLSSPVSELLAVGQGAVLALGESVGDDGHLHSNLALIDASGAAKTLSDPASTDRLNSVAELAGGGFAASLTITAVDGSTSGAVEYFDSTGAVQSRTPLGPDLYATDFQSRPDGGLYAETSPTADFFEPLDAGTFSPPPSPGVSIKAGPAVTISVLRSAGYAGAMKKAKFLLTRSGDLSKDLNVRYQVRGTAVSGRDYLPLRGEKIIKAGRATAKIKVRPMGARYGRVRAGSASVRLVLIERRAYSLGAPATAKVHLLNHRGAKEQP